LQIEPSTTYRKYSYKESANMPLIDIWSVNPSGLLLPWQKSKLQFHPV
jgi:hypothetical protein